MCDARTGGVVWDLKSHVNAYSRWRDGQRDVESGEYIAQLDFSDFTKLGRYWFRFNGLRSCAFNIGANVYEDAAKAAWKAFYYQRADLGKSVEYGGLWNHAPDHRGPNQATQARVYRWNGGNHWDPVGTVVDDPTPRDVSGGWWDAGDFNKYTGNTVLCHDDLLLSVQLLDGFLKDRQWSIPESGNGVPDALDEARCGTDYLLKLSDGTGAAFGRVHEDGTCPPELDKNPVQLTCTTRGATMNRAAALAYASIVWSESGYNPHYAKRCMRESLRSWNLISARPYPWPADPADNTRQADTGDWFAADYNTCRALAAACYFSSTGDKKYDKIVHEAIAGWRDMEAGEKTERYPVVYVYIHAKGADRELADKMKRMIIKSATKAIEQTGMKRAYGAGLRGYWWGSNRLAASCGVNCILASELSSDPIFRRSCLCAAEEYLHYLLGRNPTGTCYVSNLKELGAEHSVMVMFHSWVGKAGYPNGAKYIGYGNGKIGPFPGMLVGGANGSMNKYVDSLDWKQNPWEYNEPDITYQSPFVLLIGWFGFKH